MVPATWVAWSAIVEVSLSNMVLPPNSWCDEYTQPPSHIASLLFKKALEPERFNPNTPPGCTWLVPVVAAAVVLLWVMRYLGKPKLLTPCKEIIPPLGVCRLISQPWPLA